MPWPLSQDYNEAIQSPAGNFADPDLKTGEAATNALGLPMPLSGNFADVYEVRGPNGGRWAVKCFTREVPGLRERYTEISRHLRQAKLPFTVDFSYLDQGIRVAGRWYPVLKMQWVEGLTFNQFVSQNLDKPATLEALLRIWTRMAKHLRAADVTHCDLQHGNVLLVPGNSANSLALKLIDYDGMWVPSLAGTKSGEVGHPSYQHPQRLREGTYSREVDRFPVLLIAAALCALKAKGRPLWEKYDNGDNLLFKEADLRDPLESELFRDLAELGDPAAAALATAVRKALGVGLESSPLLEEILPAAYPVRQPRAIATAPAAIPTAVARARVAVLVGEEMPKDYEELAPGASSFPRIRKAGRGGILVGVVAVVTAFVLIVGCVGAGYLATRRGGPDQVALGSSHPQNHDPVDTKTRPTVPVRTSPASTGRDKGDPTTAGPGGPDPQPLEPTPDPDRGIDSDPHGPVGEMRRFVGHTAEIRRMAVSPDGKQLLTACWDKTLRLWDVSSGRELKQWDGHKNWVHGVAFLPGGRQAVSCGKDDKNVRLWDLKDGREIRSYIGNTQGPHCVAVSGDGRLVACSGPENTVFLWNASTGKELHRLEETTGGVNTVVLSTDGKLVLTGAMQGPVRLWDADTGKQLRQFEGQGVVGLALSADAKYAVFCGTDKTMRLWDVITAKEVRPFEKYNSVVYSVAFSPDGRRVLTGGGDETVRLWDTVTGKELYCFRGHKNHIWTVAFSPGGRYAYSSGQDAVVRMWRLPPPGWVPQDATTGDPAVKKPESKLLVPSNAAVSAAEKEAKEVYKDEYAKRKPEDFLALANQMLKDSLETKDKPALRYFLLREAGDLAVRLGDVPLAFRATDEMANHFAVDAREQKTAALELAGRKAVNLPDHANIILFALALADDAEEEDEYETADRLVKVAQASAVVTRQPAHTNLVQGRVKEVADLRKAYEAIPDAVRVLASKSDDPDANLIVGRFYALAKGDWDRGLKPLSLGSDPKLQSLALADLTATTDATAAANLGDGYADRAEAETGEAKMNLLGRASYWYGRAQLKAKGEDYARLEKKRAEIEKTLPQTRPVVLFASYGAYNGWADVTATLRRQLLQTPGQKLPSKVIDYGVDPAPGLHKTVVVVYRYRGAARLRISGEPNTPSIPAAPGSPEAETGRPAPGQELTVLYALYGNEATYGDVTEKIQATVKGGTADTNLNQLNLPDYFFGRYKAVIVVYRQDGRIRLSICPQEGNLHLGMADRSK